MVHWRITSVYLSLILASVTLLYVHLIRFVPSMKFTSWLSFGFYPLVLGFKIGDATDKENLLPFGITIGVASSGMRIKLYFTPIFNLSQYFD